MAGRNSHTVFQRKCKGPAASGLALRGWHGLEDEMEDWALILAVLRDYTWKRGKGVPSPGAIKMQLSVLVK